MRIIGGALRGRLLPARPAAGTRPTSDRVREAIASALSARGAFDQASVLDAFAGTGALGFEALSRGALRVLAVDSDRRALLAIRENAQALGLGRKLRALPLDLLGPATKVAAALEQSGFAPFSLVFADPPYSLAQSATERLAELAQRSLFEPGALVVLEHAARTLPALPAGFRELSSYRYGDTGVRLWETIAPPQKS